MQTTRQSRHAIATAIAAFALLAGSAAAHAKPVAIQNLPPAAAAVIVNKPSTPRPGWPVMCFRAGMCF